MDTKIPQNQPGNRTKSPETNIIVFPVARDLDDCLGIGAFDSGHPDFKHAKQKRTERRIDPVLDEAAISRYRGAEGYSPYYT